MRPHAQVVRRFAARGAQLWLGIRLLGSAVLTLAGANPLQLDFSATAFIIATCVAVGMVDIERRHERMLLANLSVSRAASAAFFAIPAIVAEGVIAALGRMFA